MSTAVWDLSSFLSSNALVLKPNFSTSVSRVFIVSVAILTSTVLRPREILLFYTAQPIFESFSISSPLIGLVVSTLLPAWLVLDLVRSLLVAGLV